MIKSISTKKKLQLPNCNNIVRGYMVSIDGKIYKPDGTECKIHKNKGKSAFVRLNTTEPMVSKSVCVGKIVLYTFKPKGYRKSLVAIHKDPFNIEDNSLNNLKWGTRQEQAKKTTVKHYKIVSNIHKFSPTVSRWKKGQSGRIYNEELKKEMEERHSNIRKLIIEGLSNSEISEKLKAHRSTVWTIRKTMSL
jgi:hypothetical protein